MAGGIRIGKPDSFGCKPVDVGCLVKAAPIAADVRPAEVIDEKEDDVGLPRFGDSKATGDKTRNIEGREQAGWVRTFHEKCSSKIWAEEPTIAGIDDANEL